MPKILFITVDEQRFDALGCTGGRFARTPNLDRLAATGLNYRRAYVNNVTCMPSRATMVTGQHPATHGVYTNGVPLPADAPSIAEHLKAHGFATALIGKAHLEPVKGKPEHFWEVRSGTTYDTGPYRGFDHVEISSHGKGVVRNHYQVWMERNCPDQYDHYLSQTGSDGKLNTSGGGDTGAIQVHRNPISPELYHTNWLADRAIDWLSTRKEDSDWFAWISFGDPHHPFQPPQSQLGRVDWRSLPLPSAHPGSNEAVRDLLATKPKHWLDFYEGRRSACSEAPEDFVPCQMTTDQVKEINAMVHVMNELVDDAIGRVFAWLEECGILDDVHIVYTSDHGSLQGDYGLLFKGPFHVDSLMRVPLIWRPCKTMAVPPGAIDEPVSLVDLAPTFCRAAGISTTEWMQGQALPLSNADRREAVLCEWEQEHPDGDIQISTIVTREHICSRYGDTNRYPDGAGELYSIADDPCQWTNLWDDERCRADRDRLLERLSNILPPRREARLVRVAGA